LQIDLETHPAGSRPTRRMVINASCASKAASTLTVEKHPRVGHTQQKSTVSAIDMPDMALCR